MQSLNNSSSTLNKLVVCDSGGGSTQLTDARGGVLALPIGSGLTRAVYQRSGGSVSAVRELILSTLPRGGGVGDYRGAWVIGLGNDSSMFALAATLLNKAIVSAADADKAVELYQSVHAKDVNKLKRNLPKLITLATLMHALRIDTVQWVRANGSCVGLLASDDDRFWAPTSPSGTGTGTGTGTTAGSVVDAGQTTATATARATTVPVGGEEAVLIKGA